MRRVRQIILRIVLGISAICVFTTPAFAAMSLDLRAVGSSGTLGGAVFLQFNDGSTGSGVLDPFLTVHADVQGHPQRGYNTDTARTVPYDENYANDKTHSILLGNISVTNYGGTDYREFLLDINQAVQSNLSVDQIEIYLVDPSYGANIDTYADLSSQGNLIYALNTPVTPLDTVAEASYDYILLDDDAGSGKGDMLALIPDALFTGLDTQYVYLYSATGLGINGTDGFEEWSISSQTIIPEPATMALLGLGALILRRRR